MNGPITASNRPRTLKSDPLAPLASNAAFARSGSTATRLAPNPTAINAAIAPYEIGQPQ